MSVMAEVSPLCRRCGIAFLQEDDSHSPICQSCDSVVFVGESNPFGADPNFALYPFPRQSSGNRLRELLGMSDLRYLSFSRVNLCQRAWRMTEARAKVERLRGRAFVLLGKKVQKAFGLEDDHDLVLVHDLGTYYLCMPHPSGLCRAWNKPGLRARTRSMFENLLALVESARAEERR